MDDIDCNDSISGCLNQGQVASGSSSARAGPGQQDGPQCRPGPINLISEESDESSVSTLSTIQSRHVTPLATPTVGMSKRTTPRSSFTTYDRNKAVQQQHHFDLAKLLDPFEQLEREFNWEDVTIRPPSAFSSMVDVNEVKVPAIEEPVESNTAKRYSTIAKFYDLEMCTSSSACISW